MIVSAAAPRCVGKWSSSLRRLRRTTLTVRAAASQTQQSQPQSPLDLVDWVLANGGRCDGVDVANLAGRDGGSGWGLKAKADTSAGTKLVDLPSKCHLTYNHASDDPRLLRLIDAVPTELWGAKLALQLLVHRVQGADSPFSTYISNLPIGVPGIPMFFARDAIAAIEYPPVSEQVRKRCKWLLEFSRDTLAKLPGTSSDAFSGTTVDINAMGWALACVTSRAFRTKGPEHPASCLPLIDMANHSFTPNVEVRPTDLGIGLFAKQKLAAGEPLLLSYGKLSNDFLLMDYGFVVEDNPHDRVQLRFGVDLLQTGGMVAQVDLDGKPLEDLQPSAWQRRLLEELKLIGPDASTEVAFGGPQHVDSRLLAAARVLCALSQEEVKGRTLERLGELVQPVNRRNERCALRALSGVAAFSLSRFSTTTEQDEQTLITGFLPAPTASSGTKEGPSKQGAAASASSSGAGGTPLTDDMRLAIRFRIGKKRILSAAIEKLGRQLQQLPRAAVAETSTAPRKGQAPLAATSKGFGKQAK